MRASRSAVTRSNAAEVEAALRGLPGVLDAAVEAERDPADPSGDVRLVGYLVANDGGFATEVVRLGLAERLPRYMLPTELRVLAAFPLMATGKVDRAALHAVPALSGPIRADVLPPVTLSGGSRRSSRTSCGSRSPAGAMTSSCSAARR